MEILILIYLIIGLGFANYGMYFNIKHNNYKIIEKEFKSNNWIYIKILDYLTWIFLWPVWLYKYFKK